MSDIKSACPKDKCTSVEIDQRIDDRGLETVQLAYGTAFGLAGAAAIPSAVLFVLHGAQTGDGRQA